MARLIAFVGALWQHARWVLTSSGLAVALVAYEHFEHALPAAWFWAVLLVAFFWSAFLAWGHEHQAHRTIEEKLVNAEAKLLSTKAKLLDATPQLLVEYDGPGIQHNAERLRVRNTSNVPAYNVQLRPFASADLTAVFPLVNHLPAGGTLEQEIHTAEDGPLPLNRLYDLLMRGRPQDDLAAWAAPVNFEMTVRYTDFGGDRFESTTRFRYTPVTRAAEFLGVTGKHRID